MSRNVQPAVQRSRVEGLTCSRLESAMEMSVSRCPLERVSRNNCAALLLPFRAYYCWRKHCYWIALSNPSDQMHCEYCSVLGDGAGAANWVSCALSSDTQRSSDEVPPPIAGNVIRWLRRTASNRTLIAGYARLARSLWNTQIRCNCENTAISAPIPLFRTCITLLNIFIFSLL